MSHCAAATPKHPNTVHGIVGVGLAALGILAFFCSWARVATSVAVVLDIYAIFLLVTAAYRSDGHAKASDFLPTKLMGLVLLSLLLCALLFSFATKFIACRQICPSGCQPCIGADPSAKLCDVQRDALYFSLVTAATVGYGDYTPVDGARYLVMWEICSSMLLLALAFPVLLSRMASW